MIIRLKTFCFAFILILTSCRLATPNKEANSKQQNRSDENITKKNRYVLVPSSIGTTLLDDFSDETALNLGKKKTSSSKKKPKNQGAQIGEQVAAPKTSNKISNESKNANKTTSKEGSNSRESKEKKSKVIRGVNNNSGDPNLVGLKSAMANPSNLFTDVEGSKVEIQFETRADFITFSRTFPIVDESHRYEFSIDEDGTSHIVRTPIGATAAKSTDAPIVTAISKIIPDLSIKLLDSFPPVVKLEVGGKIFHFSQPVNQGTHLVSMIYREVASSGGKSELVPLFGYRSLSDGVWRITNYPFKKGALHYTQHTRAAAPLGHALESLHQSAGMRSIALGTYNLITQFFNKKSGDYTAQSPEVGKFYDMEKAVKPLKLPFLKKFYLPSFNPAEPTFVTDERFEEPNERKEFFEELRKAFAESPLAPEIKLDSLNGLEQYNHSLLGHTNVYRFESKDGKLVWGIALAEGGQMWIDSVLTKGQEVNEFGHSATIVMSGGLTAKAVEYFEKGAQQLYMDPRTPFVPPGEPAPVRPNQPLYAFTYYDQTAVLKELIPVLTEVEALI